MRPRRVRVLQGGLRRTWTGDDDVRNGTRAARSVAALAWSGDRAGPNRRQERLASLFAIIALAISATGIFEHAGESAPADEIARTEAEERKRLALPTREWMVGAYGGAQYTYPSEVRLTKPGSHDLTVESVGWDGEPFIDPIYYGVRIVRWLEGGRTGAMLDFTHSKALAQLGEQASFKGTVSGKPAPPTAKLGDVFRRLEFSHGHNMLTLNGLMRLGSLGPRLFPYVGLGVGVNLPHTEVQLIGERGRTYEYQYTGPVVQAVLGIELRIPRMSYFLEYKFSLASYAAPLSGMDGGWLPFDLLRQIRRWLTGEPPPGGYLDTRLTSHQVIGGLGVRFGAAP